MWDCEKLPQEYISLTKVSHKCDTFVADKRTWLLCWAQSCVHFSVAAFWILWAPTIVVCMYDHECISLCFLFILILKNTLPSVSNKC